jgi:hypothetical protein
MTQSGNMQRLCASFAWGVIVGLVSSCGLLDTPTPDIIDPGDLNTPEGAQAKRIGAITEFGFAKDGAFGQILLSGVLSDEFLFSSVFTDEAQIDQRSIHESNPSLLNLYFQLHRARGGIENAIAALETALPAPESDTGISELLSLAGFTYIYFGEVFCSGVPIGRVVGDSLIHGRSLATAELYDTALARFDSALAHPAVTNDPNVQNLARVGRARVLLDQGQFAAAAAGVAEVPTEFQYLTEHAASPANLINGIFPASFTEVSVADSEGGNGLPYRTAADARVPFLDTGQLGIDGLTPQFNLLKYPDVSTPVVVADGIEARLIEAEAQLEVSDTATMLMTLNTLRQGAGLADLAGPSTVAEAEDMLFSERAFWLFATGHRLGDMRRLIRQYGRNEAAVFPVGPYIKGGVYGSDVNLPIPVEERNNPNFQGCIDRNA